MRPALSGVWSATALLTGQRNLDGELKKPKRKPEPGVFEELLKAEEKKIDERSK